MAIHNEAQPYQIAKTVLMPGDPLRAKQIAEEYLTNAKCVNQVRGMLAFTGMYRGKRVTVMGSGMGVPSMGIYSHELYKFYDVETIIRIGSCGAYSPELELRDILLVTASHYDGAYGQQYTGTDNHLCFPDKELNAVIKETAGQLRTNILEGEIATVEAFDPYLTDPLSIMRRYHKDKQTQNIVGSEMESFALFTNADFHQKRAACLLTVADSSFKNEKLTAKERQNTMDQMIHLALETARKI